MNDGVPQLHGSEAVFEVHLGVVGDGHDQLEELVLLFELIDEVHVVDVVLDVELVITPVQVVERSVPV